jgi:hypothetical protein
MARRVPEFALVTGSVLGGSLLLAGLLFTNDPALTVVLAGAVVYGFVAYAVVHDGNPTNVLPPRVVLGAGTLVGLAAAGVVAAYGATPLPARGFLAVVVGLGFLLPTAAYRVSYGAATGPSPVRTATGCVLGGVGLVVGGLIAGATLYAAVAGLLVALAGLLYARSRGVSPSHRTRRRWAAVGVGLAVAILGLGVATAVPVAQALPVAAVLALGPAAYHALASDASGRLHS